MLIKSMRIPRLGFTIEERQKVVDRNDVYEALTPARQRKSTIVVFENDNIVITKHVIVCPWCGKEAPAYQNYQMKPYQLMDIWISQQTSMSERQPKTLILNRPIEVMNVFVCPKCNSVSFPRKGFVDVLFTADRKVMKITRRLEMKELFKIKWSANKICITNFELYEAITFNLKNGHTFVSLEDARGEKLQAHDVSNIKTNLYSDDPIFELINLYKPVNRELKNQFVKIFHRSLPFRTKELTAEQFILMTKFVGYDAEFYNALPYAEGDLLIERRFTQAAKRLHVAKNVPNLFEKTMLPKTKSIRKIFFCNPVLFFYAAELEQLWQIMEDINFYRDFITSQNIFYELEYLCKMPHLMDFYAEYKTELGITKLYKKIFQTSNRIGLYNYASWYYMLSQYDKKIERQKWHKGRLDSPENLWNVENDIGSFFAIPITEHETEMTKRSAPESCIYGYSFRRLKNSLEYMQASKELKNCLNIWRSFRNNVYGIIKNNKYVAAVEIKNKVIIQAYTYRDEEIASNRNIKKVFDIWKSKKSMTERQGKEFD